MRDERIQDAINAYWNWCKRHGHMPQQPDYGMCDREDGIITLRNVNGVLARYQIIGPTRLTRLD